MKPRFIVSAILFLLILLLIAAPIFGRSGDDDIQVSDADEIRTEVAVSSEELIDVTNAVQPRTVVQYANVVQHIILVAIPSKLDQLLQAVSDRIIIQYADTNKTVALVYPEGLFDTTPSPTPTISPTPTPTIGANPFDSPLYIPLVIH